MGRIARLIAVQYNSTTPRAGGNFNKCTGALKILFFILPEVSFYFTVRQQANLVRVLLYVKKGPLPLENVRRTFTPCAIRVK